MTRLHEQAHHGRAWTEGPIESEANAWRPTSGGQIPSRQALTHAEQTNAELGHENLGFLSPDAGFLPRRLPLLRLPPSHHAWDEVAATLPERWAATSVRQALADLPILSAAEADLPDEYLWRASTILSVLAHAWVRSEIEPAGDVPPGVQRPWNEITQRLGRPEPFLSYGDLILYNWRLRDAGRPDPLRVENLDLLVPTVDNQEERVFYLTQVEILAQCSPVVEAVVRAQEATVTNDREGLERALLVILERLQHVTEVSLLKIDPNSLAATHVDPVVWANTVAPFAVAIKQGTAGPSGTSAPIFHLLDIFLGRRLYATRLGEEMEHLRPWFPPHHRAFLHAVGQIQVRDWIERFGDPVLKGLFQAVFDAYAGERGYLGVHRRKAYGYLEIAFKVGRQVTIGGFTGAFKDRPWKEVHAELENTRVERHTGLPVHPYTATLSERSATAPTGPARLLVLDIAGSGITYRPGDRIGILPENTAELVRKTLTALRAVGSEKVPLTQLWRAAVRYRSGHESADELSLEDFLRFAKLRPLLRTVGKALHAISASPGLQQVLEARQEDQWELWDALELVHSDGYDTARLWSSRLWQDEAIARIVPPEPFRLYSVSSAPDQLLPAELHLTVREVQFDTRVNGRGPVRRHGTASMYLTRGAPLAGAARIPVLPVRPLRFRLPVDPRRPIAMFAGGTGISPFRGFLLERAATPDAGGNYLFFSARDRTELHYRELLEHLIRQATLRLAIAISGEDVDVRFDPDVDGGRLVFEPAPARRIDALLQEEQHARVVWQLVGGGDRGYLYICGQAAFAQSVMTSLVSAVARFSSGTPAKRELQARLALRELVAEGRLMLDVFTTSAPEMAPGVLGSGQLNASDLVVHNDDEHGYWMSVNGAVCDVTEFMHLHPGGNRIILENVGLDATREYQAVEHHQHSEVDAVLSMYKIGHLRRLDFGGAWGVALQPSGLSYLSLHDAFRAWVRYLYLLVEMQNALRNDFAYLDRPVTRGEEAFAFAPLKAMLVANTHRRFLASYFDAAMGKEVTDLWALTVGLCDSERDVRWLERELGSVRADRDAQVVRRFSRRLSELYQEVRRASDADAVRLQEYARAVSVSLRRLDTRFLQDMKMVVRDGVMVFEEHEAETIRKGGALLVECLERVPRVAAAFFAALAEEIRASESTLGAETGS